MTAFSDRVVEATGEAFTAQAGPLLAALVDALTTPVADTDAQLQPGPRGWAGIYDLDQTIDPAWLGQLAGTRVPDGLTSAQARDYVRSRPGFRRGTPGALKAAVAALLTGNQRVELIERDGSPWRLTVQILAGEIGDGVTIPQIRAAIDSQKPVGIIATLEVRSGASFQHMANRHGPTFTAEATAFPTFADAIAHQPEPGTEV